MKYIFKLLTLVFVSFFIISCGSEDSALVSSSNIIIASTKSTLTASKKTMNIDFLLTNNYSSKVVVQVKKLSLDIASCTVASSTLTPNNFTFNDKKSIQINAKILFTEACTPSTYNLKGITILTLDGKAREITLDATSKELNTTILTSVGSVSDTNETNSQSDGLFDNNSTVNENNLMVYKLINASVLSVEAPSLEYNISVDLVDNQGVGVPSKEIKISTPMSKYGSVLYSSARTDASGRATFVYKSPADIRIIDKESIHLNLSFIENDTRLKTVSKLTFYRTSRGVPKNNYRFINATNLILDRASKEEVISVDLVDNRGVGVEGKEVKITTPDNRFGFISYSTTRTDDTGRATFSYQAPSDIDVMNGQSTDLNITFTEDGVTLSKMVKITVLKKSAIDYHLINTTDLLVEFPNKEYAINAYLVDNRGVAVSGKSIEITTPNSRFGELSSFVKTTAQTTGKVSFIYTSPSDIKAIDGESTSVTVFFIEDGVELNKTIQINFSVGIEDTTLPTVVIPSDLREIILSNNSQTVDIPIKVFKDITPYTSGFVNIQLPQKVLDGVDVGSFSSFSIPVDEDGIALLSYTGPSNLKALVDGGDLNSTFKIYHSENTSNENRKSLLVKYDVSADDYVPINYGLGIVAKEGNFSMGIPDIEKTFFVLLKDSEGNIIHDNDINISSIEVQTENSLLVQLYDSNNSILVDMLTLENKNNSPFTLQSKRLSGLVPIKVTMRFKDINDKEQILSTVINVRVMSGLPSAISISYLSSGQDSGRVKYEEKFIVSVTDEYSNRVNTRPYIALGAIVGYAVDGKEATSRENNLTRRLFYGKKDIDNGNAEGTIDDLGDSDVHKTTFRDDTVARADVFQYVNREGNNSDKLIVFGRGKSYDAMGKWDFDKIDNSTLNLQDDYFGQTKGELYYAVGHNYYQDPCLDDGREWLGTTDSETYQLDDEGSVLISYKYDYQLMGKDAMIWVNLNGYQPDIAKNIRIGEAIKHTLRGTGLRTVPEGGYSLDKNTTRIVTFEVWQKETTEAYRNAHFGWEILGDSKCQILSHTSSNPYDARTCNNGYSSEGRSYITFELQAPTDTGCNFNINTLISHEF